MTCNGYCDSCPSAYGCDKVPSNHQGGCSPDKCATCPSRGQCASANEPTETTLKIAERLKHFQRVYIVISGKGGVGKSTVATQLAYSLSECYGIQISLMDVDICGPSIPTMTSTAGEEIRDSADGWAPVNVTDKLYCISIGFMLRNLDDAVIMRGPKKHGVIQQFLTEVDWNIEEGHPSWLILDTPPGTSDEHLSTINMITTACRYSETKPEFYAILVTTPQEVALADVRKEVNFCRQIGLPIRGVIENMSGFVCPHCNKETQIFKPSTGGAAHLCEQFELDLLGRVPLDPLLTQASEDGMPWCVVAENKNETSLGLEMFEAIVKKVVEG